MDEALKACSLCKEPKPASHFSKHSTGTLGVHAYCKPCFNAYKVQRRKTGVWQNREKKYNDRHNIEKLYDVSIAEYREMVRKADGVCEICGGLPKGKGRLSIDHCHTTGRIRGVLCGPCNSVLGMAQESEDILNKAVSYLRSKKP
jgi:hypothetical protein